MAAPAQRRQEAFERLVIRRGEPQRTLLTNLHSALAPLRLYTLAFMALPFDVVAAQPEDMLALLVKSARNPEVSELLVEEHFSTLLFCQRHYLGDINYINSIHEVNMQAWLNDFIEEQVPNQDDDDDEDDEGDEGDDKGEEVNEEEEETDATTSEEESSDDSDDSELEDAAPLVFDEGIILYSVPEERPTILERCVFSNNVLDAYERDIIAQMRPGIQCENNPGTWALVSFSFTMMLAIGRTEFQLNAIHPDGRLTPALGRLPRFSSWAIAYQVYPSCNGAECAQCVEYIRLTFRTITTYVKHMYARHLLLIHQLHKTNDEAAKISDALSEERFLSVLYFIFQQNEQLKNEAIEIQGNLITLCSNREKGTKYSVMRASPDIHPPPPPPLEEINS